MQIRELPRGGQYSLKGNVINVPVDIQPTVNSLPRPMDENFTIAVQLKKKMSYRKCDFTENVRPVRVLTALHWLVNKSELYKNSGINIDENWFKEVTESTEDTVREFLQVHSEQSNQDANVDIVARERHVDISDVTHANTDGYESDNFSEIDTNEQVGNVDTMVDDANIESKSNQVFTFAPGEGQHPLSLYQDTDAEYLCFPSIFCGQRRPENSARLAPVYYSDIAKWELRSIDRRASQSVPNIFFKHKKIQMKQISDKVNLALRKCKRKDNKLTAAEARNPSCVDKLVRLDEGYFIFRQLRNSPAYLEARKKDIFAMIRQLGLPTWFMSLSAADTRWKDLLRMLAKLNEGVEYSDSDIEKLTWQQKTKLVQKDPVTCSRYFDHRVQQFINTVLKSNHEPIGKLKDFFYRVEFQQRGSPHIHMLVWIENAPKYENSSEEELIEYVDSYLTCDSEDTEIEELVQLQTHKHSKTCRKKCKPICRFGFPLPPLPRTMLLHPLDENVDTYKKKYLEMQKAMNEYKDVSDLTFEEFLDEIVHMNGEDYIKCIRSSLNCPKIFLRRKPSQMRINLFNRTLLLAWKANLDIQFVFEPYGCAMYIVGYISKSQRGMSAQLDAAAKDARKGNYDLKKQVRHIGNVFSNCVEVSAQEAVYLVLQIPLTKGTRDVIFVNTSPPEDRLFLLKPKSVLDELPAESTDIESDNIIQRYSKRPRQLQKWCLADYVSELDIIYPKENVLHEKGAKDKNEDDVSDKSSDDDNDSDDENKFSDSDIVLSLKNGIKIKRRKVPKIIRYVRYSVKTDPESFYRERIMLFLPWRCEDTDVKNGFGSFKAHYDSKKAIIDQKSKVYEHHMEELDMARQLAELDFDIFDEIAPNAEQEQREAEQEGVTEAERFVYFNPERTVEHREYDIGIELGNACSIPCLDTSGVKLSDERYLEMIQSLNIRQREFFNHVVHWIKTKEEPIYAFLSGGAGVGKSVLIKALYQALYRHLNLKEGENPDDIRILLCAFMGKAAYNINGVTIDSAFRKKYNQINVNLTSDELNTFRVKYRHLRVVIIDEISMVGSRRFNFIDTRLQELTGTRSHFGGLSIIAVGDLYQLAPVGDQWIFSDPSTGA
ncbi:MAG: AAA family ATPase [gamma proteobacterium symbiont of Lucinoma myriamae]|nr:AAA family ATPase [gamma proteobacterium symbiont of Lucinoma myriamae]